MLNIGQILETAHQATQALLQHRHTQAAPDLPVDHIGFAVHPNGLEATLHAWGLLGYLVTERELVTSQKAWATMLRPGGNIQAPGPGLELVMPALELETPEVAAAFEAREVAPGMSPMTQYLVRSRPGLHHIAFEVPPGTLQDVRTQLIADGLEVLGDDVRPGAFGTTVFFTKPDRGSPAQPGPAVLIEYVDTIGVDAWRQQHQ